MNDLRKTILISLAVLFAVVLINRLFFGDILPSMVQGDFQEHWQTLHGRPPVGANPYAPLTYWIFGPFSANASILYYSLGFLLFLLIPIALYSASRTWWTALAYFAVPSPFYLTSGFFPTALIAFFSILILCTKNPILKAGLVFLGLFTHAWGLPFLLVAFFVSEFLPKNWKKEKPLAVHLKEFWPFYVFALGLLAFSFLQSWRVILVALPFFTIPLSLLLKKNPRFFFFFSTALIAANLVFYYRLRFFEVHPELALPFL